MSQGQVSELTDAANLVADSVHIEIKRPIIYTNFPPPNLHGYIRNISATSRRGTACRYLYTKQTFRSFNFTASVNFSVRRSSTPVTRMSVSKPTNSMATYNHVSMAIRTTPTPQFMVTVNAKVKIKLSPC
jgi:hypothetical protein